MLQGVNLKWTISLSHLSVSNQSDFALYFVKFVVFPLSFTGAQERQDNVLITGIISTE